MSTPRHLRNIVGTKNEVITAEVTATGTGTAKVRRAGQTNSTKSLPVASGVTVTIGDWVQVMLYNSDINTGVITQKIR